MAVVVTSPTAQKVTTANFQRFGAKRPERRPKQAARITEAPSP
jgi:hypothetical protein